ncbi:unnamed protein product [Dracunculus medinensis]|uniref:Uncharacterized protein n=1 Tax=Dracunculus medinensis TaxID=318479 RepID=A0A0N4U5X8_DRAME|nr:unnamed protein product [Dracunculus medinensis]
MAYSDVEEGYSYSSSTQKRPLLRTRSHNGPSFRTLPLFGFLLGLIVAFYIFYLYFVSSDELSEMKRQFNVLEGHSVKLKDENLEMKILLDNYKEKEVTLQNAKELVETKLNECSRNLESIKQDYEKSKVETNNIDKQRSECSKDLLELQNGKNAMEEIIATLRVKVDNYERLIIYLNQTIARLEAEGAKTSEKVVEPFLQKPDQVVQQVDQVDVVHQMHHEARNATTVNIDQVISNVDQAKEGGINFGKVVPLIKSKTEGSEETDFKENIPAPQEMPRVNEQFGVVRPGPGDRVKMEMNGGQVEDGGDSKLVAGFADFQDENMLGDLKENVARIENNDVKAAKI